MKKKANSNKYNISSIKRVTRKFLEVSRYSRAKQRQRNIHKKCAGLVKWFLLLLFFRLLELLIFLAVFVAVAA